MANKILSGVTFDASRKTTPATEKAAKGQVKSHQGGYVFTVSDMERARRFLILGSESSFYQAGGKLAMENATTLRKIATSDAVFELIDLITDISVGGRAPKQSPGLFALALVIGSTSNQEAKAYAYLQLPKVARTASTLFEFVGYLSQFQKLGGMGFQKAIGRWYTEKSLDSLAYQMVKYRQRDGMDHSRLLRLSKRVKSNDRPELAPLLDWALGKAVEPSTLPSVIQGFEVAKTIDPKRMPEVIREHRLSWEMIPTERLNDVKVWDALLDGNVPLGALIRQLPRLTNLGIISQLGGRTAEIEDRLRDVEALRKARIHPLQALVSMRTYASGRGMSQTWTPVQRIADALEDAFYAAFETVEPTGKRWMLGLDLSASMTWSNVAGMPITPREASATMAMVTARTERESFITGFSGGWSSSDMIPLTITGKTRLQDAIREIESKPAGGTNLSLPMEHALAKKIPVDAFVVYTDNELGIGRRHPFQALRAYRDAMGIDAKLIVVAMTATKFSIADPSDPGMLDIAGFDTAAPGLMAEFVR